MAIVLPVMYIGNGDYLIGVPARDMALEEWEALPETVRANALRLRLYQIGTVKHSVGWNEKRAPAATNPHTAGEKENHHAQL